MKVEYRNVILETLNTHNSRYIEKTDLALRLLPAAKKIETNKEYQLFSNVLNELITEGLIKSEVVSTNPYEHNLSLTPSGYKYVKQRS